jgi:hypothetical protein
MLGCNRPRWRGIKLVTYTFLEIVNRDCMDGWSRSRHSKVPKQLAVDGSKLSERCKARQAPRAQRPVQTREFSELSVSN